MSDLSVEQKLSHSTLMISLSGSITETSNFPQIKVQGVSEIAIDLGGLTYINSAGVRRWILWMWTIEKDAVGLAIYIDRCPPMMVKQIMSIKEFVPKAAITRSFYVPYFCDHCDEGLEKLMYTDSKIQADPKTLEALLAQAVQCPTCFRTMELDALPNQYFKLLRYQDQGE